MRTYLAAAMLAAPLWAASGWLAAPAGLNAAEGDPVAKVEPQPVLAATESTLKSDGDRIRALAFDGDEATAFVSSAPVKSTDHLTLRFDNAVKVSSLRVLLNAANDKDAPAAEYECLVSADGESFKPALAFEGAEGKAELDKSPIQAIRIQPKADLSKPLAIREIVIESDPPVQKFVAPVEFVIDSTDAPDLAEWLEGVRKLCERQYPMIASELRSEGFTPPRVVKITLSNEYEGVAAAMGDRIVGSVKYYRGHKDDVGSMVHETAHVVQSYRRRGSPSWLVEGIADYIRFVKFEPQNIGRIDPRRARYDGSYRTSAAFLGYVAATYDKDLVLKLNAACRAGEYRDELFEQYTRKPLKDLDAEWRATLK